MRSTWRQKCGGKRNWGAYSPPFQEKRWDYYRRTCRTNDQSQDELGGHGGWAIGQGLLREGNRKLRQRTVYSIDPVHLGSSWDELLFSSHQAIRRVSIGYMIDILEPLFSWLGYLLHLLKMLQLLILESGGRGMEIVSFEVKNGCSQYLYRILAAATFFPGIAILSNWIQNHICASLSHAGDAPIASYHFYFSARCDLFISSTH